jgi:hypothetical protein
MKPRRKVTKLDAIRDKIRHALGGETHNIVTAGYFLGQSREREDLQHGEWMQWIEKEFEFSYRTALRYVAAAAFAVDKLQTKGDVVKSDTVAIMAARFVSPTVLYNLAEGRYTLEQADAIVAAIKECKVRIEPDRAANICVALIRPPEPAPPPEPMAPPEPAKSADGDGGDDPDAILDGPPPELPPAPSAAAADFLLPAFDRALDQLQQLSTKPAAKFTNRWGNRPASLWIAEDFGCCASG